MKILNSALLDDLTRQARVSPRRRQNLNLHADYSEPCQRLLNAMEPGSYIRPHRHLRDPKPECFIGLRGKFALILFSDNGGIEHVLPFGPNEENVGADLPPGIWHTVVCLEEGSVFFETKPGPYLPLADKDWSPWAPEEGSVEAQAYLQELARVVAERRHECGRP